jgi:hypothetical protein
VSETSHSEPGEGEAPSDPAFHLYVETRDGVYLRTIANVVREDSDDHGREAEKLTKELAMAWGLPDFIFQPVNLRTGSGQREIGDALVIIGNLGACVQIKSKQEITEDSDREESWLNKNIKRATSQANGTIRQLRIQKSLRLENARGHSFEIVFTQIDWIPVVVVDHPGLDSYTPPPGAIVLTLNDWNFLFDQLKSTFAVLGYLKRIRGLEPVQLGRESVRYYEHAQADYDSPPTDLPAGYRIEGTTHYSGPLLPMAPAGQGGEQEHALVRMICEDVANSPDDEINEPQRHSVLAALDSLAVSARTALGKKMSEWLDEAHKLKGKKWQFRARNIVAPNGAHIMLCVGTDRSEKTTEEFSWYVSLRREEFIEKLPHIAEGYSVGVLLSPTDNPNRSWDLTLIATNTVPDLSVEVRAALEAMFGPLGKRTEQGSIDGTS